MNGRIGPHTGKELRLLLEGKKNIAYFWDWEPPRAFLAAVRRGDLRRIEVVEEITGTPMPGGALYPPRVFYVRPGWEAEVTHLLAWLNRSATDEAREMRLLAEIMVGKILGYTDADIRAFLAHALGAEWDEVEHLFEKATRLRKQEEAVVAAGMADLMRGLWISARGD